MHPFPYILLVLMLPTTFMKKSVNYSIQLDLKIIEISMFKYVKIWKGIGFCTTCVANFKADKILWSWGLYFETFLENALACSLMSAILNINCGRKLFYCNFFNTYRYYTVSCKIPTELLENKSCLVKNTKWRLGGKQRVSGNLFI